jgi:hypothetical protein
MKKLLCVSIVFALCASISIPAVAASDWAESEIAEIEAFGDFMFPEYMLQWEYSRPITRSEFAGLAVYFTMFQYNAELNIFNNFFFEARGIARDTFRFTDVASDGSGSSGFGGFDSVLIHEAYDLGIVSGYGDGAFRPDNAISRQEAAKMLLNVYRVYAEYNGGAVEHGFADNVSDWAAEAVYAMRQWGVMEGVGDNRFDPQGTYTVEQSLVTFLRLYKNAPVSQAKGNVVHYMTFEESYARAVANQLWQIDGELELSNAVIIYSLVSGLPRGGGYHSIYAVYRTGGLRNLLWRQENYGEIINSIEADEAARVIRFALETGPGAKIYEARY